MLPCGPGPSLICQAISEAGRCRLLDFLPWLSYSCRHGSVGLHPVYGDLSITTQSAHQAQTKTKEWCCTAPAEQVGSTWHTKFSVIQMLLPAPVSAAAQHRPAASQPCVPGDACPSPRAHLCTVQETHHRLQPEPTEKVLTAP